MNPKTRKLTSSLQKRPTVLRIRNRLGAAQQAEDNLSLKQHELLKSYANTARLYHSRHAILSLENAGKKIKRKHDFMHPCSLFI
jgi:hypothetical protein